MLDSDVAVFRHLATRFESLHADVVAQREIPCKNYFCINAGVVWYRTHSAAVLSLVERAVYLMTDLRMVDQDALQMVMDTAIDGNDPKHNGFRNYWLGVNVHFVGRGVAAESSEHWFENKAHPGDVELALLSPDQYPNGFVHQINQRLFKSAVHLVHVNWAPSVDVKWRRLIEIEDAMWLSLPSYLPTPFALDIDLLRATIVRMFSSDAGNFNLKAALGVPVASSIYDYRLLPCFYWLAVNTSCGPGFQMK